MVDVGWISLSFHSVWVLLFKLKCFVTFGLNQTDSDYKLSLLDIYSFLKLLATIRRIKQPLAQMWSPKHAARILLAKQVLMYVCTEDSSEHGVGLR